MSSSTSSSSTSLPLPSSPPPAYSSFSNPPVRIRYRFGMAPDHVITNDPSLMETVKGMDKIDGAVFLTTVLIPSIYGYRTQKSFSSLYFKFGLGTGLLAGAAYAYFRSWARLTGISIPTPEAPHTEYLNKI